jgi:hypothetical protein|tara:strand:- start:720 stop:893 length:174 start_codon:yes stop_codon:yes gene_type:complete
MKYQVKVDIPTIDGILYKGTELITEEDVSSKDRVRCKDRTGKIWYLSYHQIERVKGE